MDQVSLIPGSRSYELGVVLCSISSMSVCFFTGFMGVVSVAFSGKVCVWLLHWQSMKILMFWLLRSCQSLITNFGILERGWYVMISGNMGLYSRPWYIYVISVRLQHILHLVSLNQMQIQLRRRVLKRISMLGSNTFEKEAGEGLLRRLRDNRNERFRKGVRIWIVILLALILRYNNNGDVLDWDEITTGFLYVDIVVVL